MGLGGADNSPTNNRNYEIFPAHGAGLYQTAPNLSREGLPGIFVNGPR